MTDRMKIVPLNVDIANEIDPGLGTFLSEWRFTEVVIPLKSDVWTASAFGGWKGSYVDNEIQTYNGTLRWHAGAKPRASFAKLGIEYLEKIGEPFVMSPSWE